MWPRGAGEIGVSRAFGSLGETRGVIGVDSDRPDAFSAEDQELLEQLAVQAAKVIQNTWLYEQLRLKVHFV